MDGDAIARRLAAHEEGMLHLQGQITAHKLAIALIADIACAGMPGAMDRLIGNLRKAQADARQRNGESGAIRELARLCELLAPGPPLADQKGKRALVSIELFKPELEDRAAVADLVMAAVGADDLDALIAMWTDELGHQFLPVLSLALRRRWRSAAVWSRPAPASAMARKQAASASGSARGSIASTPAPARTRKRTKADRPAAIISAETCLMAHPRRGRRSGAGASPRPC